MINSNYDSDQSESSEESMSNGFQTIDADSMLTQTGFQQMLDKKDDRNSDAVSSYLTSTKPSSDIHRVVVSKLFKMDRGQASVQIGTLSGLDGNGVHGYVESAQIELTEGPSSVSVKFRNSGKSATSATIFYLDGTSDDVSTVVCPRVTKEVLPTVKVPETFDMANVLEYTWEDAKKNTITQDLQGNLLIASHNGHDQAVVNVDSPLGRILQKVHPRSANYSDGDKLVVPLDVLKNTYDNAMSSRSEMDKDVRHVTQAKSSYIFDIKPLVMTPCVINSVYVATFTFNIRMLNSTGSAGPFNLDGDDDDDDDEYYTDSE